MCPKECDNQYRSVQFIRSVMSDSLRPHESQHTRPPCPSPTPGVHSDSHPMSQWCHPAICSFYACLLESFYYKWMLNFVKGFLCIYWDNHMAFIFQFVNVVYYTDWFADTEEFCIPGIKPTWSLCMIFLIYCSIVFARILLRIFALMSISDTGL